MNLIFSNSLQKAPTSMEPYTISLVLLPIMFTVLYFLKLSRKPNRPNLPPGPKTWPIIGNIHQLGDAPHLSIAELAKTYGPIMTLKLGTVTTIVVSSSVVAKEMFLKHDLAFSGRIVPEAARVADYCKHSMIWLSVGPKWRHVRKIAAIHLFANHRLDASQAQRERKVAELIDHVRHCFEKGGQPVYVGKAAFITSLNLVSNTLFSIDLASHDSSNSQEFQDAVTDLMDLGTKPNLADFFPLLRHLDLQGISKRVKGNVDKMLAIFERIIDKRLSDSMVTERDDVLSTLLKLVKDKELSHLDVKHMLMDMFIAGTDTISSTVEWAMAELMRSPEKMGKAQDELDQVIGKNNGPIQESDISKLPYIQAVVKETLRLHSPTPFLLPHKAENDVELCGYVVPKGAQIWVNVWSIGRDPNTWQEALSFSPERFLEREVDFKGRDFELIPFGAGRRMCPGMPLAYRVVNVMLANLLHAFNWKPANGLSPEEINMEEKFGLTLQKIQPLQAVPIAR